jgi:hypothetical protein
VTIAPLSDPNRAILKDVTGLDALTPSSMRFHRGANGSSFYYSKDLVVLENISNAIAKVQIGAIGVLRLVNCEEPAMGCLISWTR